MLIASRFHRPAAPVELPNADGTFTTYFFRPVDPNNPTSEHVADVTDAAHIGRLLAIPEGYYLSNAEQTLQAVGKVAKPAQPPARAPVPPKASAPPPPEATTESVDETSTLDPAPTSPAEPVAEVPPAVSADTVATAADETVAGANALLALGLSAFKKALKGQPREVLERALAIEVAAGADERATYTKALKAELA